MWMRKRGLQADLLIIKLGARGTQEAVVLSPHSTAIKYPIYGIKLQCSFTLQRATVIGV